MGIYVRVTTLKCLHESKSSLGKATKSQKIIGEHTCEGRSKAAGVRLTLSFSLSIHRLDLGLLFAILSSTRMSS